MDGEPAQDDAASGLLASWKGQLDSLTLTKAQELYEANPSVFSLLFRELDEDMGKFDDVGEWLEAHRDSSGSDSDGGLPLQSILSSSAALVRMHVVALQNPSLMLSVSEELLQRVLLLLQAIVLSKFCPAETEQPPSSTPPAVPSKPAAGKRLPEMLGAIPSMSTLLNAFLAFLEHVRPSGLLATLLLEICFAIIRSETYTGIPGIHTDHKLRPRLTALQTAASAVLVAMYRHHRSYRADILASVAQAVHNSFTVKNGLKLFVISMTSSPDDVVFISACTRVVLACSGVIDPCEENALDSDLLSRYYRPGALFATELVQSSLRKEPNTVGLQSLSDFIDEVLLAVQTPEWLVGCVLLEQIVCKLLLHLSAMRNSFGGDQKRDLSSIGQVLELLGALAEKIHTMKVHLQSKKLASELAAELTKALTSRWETRKPSWLIRPTSSTSSSSSSSINTRRRHADPPAAKSSAVVPATGNAASPGSFLQGCKMLLQACADTAIVIDEVQEKAGVFPLPHQRYLEVAFAVFPTLPAALQMGLMLHTTTVHDLQFLELLRQCDTQCGAVTGTLRLDSTALLSQWVRALQMRSLVNEAAEVAALESRLDSLGLASQDSAGNAAMGGKGEGEEARPPLDASTVQLYTKSVVFHTVLRELSEKIQELMTATLFDPSPLVRARVAKSLYRIVLTDPSMIHSEKAKENLARILRDKAISVREEGVRMVGVLLSDPIHRMNVELITELRYMMLDEGISVRKAVVNMFRDILQCQPDHPAYQDIAVSLLARMTYPKEEESIRETIRLIFQQIWFTAPSEAELQGMRRLLSAESLPSSQRGEATDEATSKSSPKSSVSSMHVEFTTRQLVKIVSVSSAVPSIERLLQDLLHSRGEGHEVAQAVSTRRRSAQTYCERIVECLVDMLLSTEEALAKESSNGEMAELRGHIVATVAMFCEVHPPFVSPHILTFLPYLKRQANASAVDVAIARHVMKIVESTAILQKNLLRNRAEEVITDLVEVVFTQGGAAVNAAISCICSLVAHVTSDALPVLRIAEKCLLAVVAITKTLPPPASSASLALQPAQSAQIQRCLVVLGSICAYSKGISDLLQAMGGPKMTAKKWMLRNEEAAQRSLSQLTTLEPHLLTGTVYSVAAHMFDFPDENIRSRAVQALCDVFTGNPRLMLVAQSTSLLQRMLTRSNAQVIHERLIAGLKQMLASEEAAQEKKASLRQLHESGVQMVTPNKVFGPGDSDSDATIAGFVIQHHLDLITQFLSHPSATLRLSTLQLLGSLLRQGMVCPLDALASLVMLQCDRDELLRTEALHLLVVQDERHPTFLDNRLREGVESAHDFQLAIFGDVRATYTLPSGDQAPYFGALYTSCVQSNKRRWQGFVQALLRKCALLAQSMAGNLPSKVEGMHNVSALQRVLRSSLSQSLYLASVLASLPYLLMEEVLFVLHLIHRNVPYDMSVCLAELRDVLLSHGAVCMADDRLCAPHGMGPTDPVDTSMPPPALPPAPQGRGGKRSKTSAAVDPPPDAAPDGSSAAPPPPPHPPSPPQPHGAEEAPSLGEEERRRDLPRMLTQLAVLHSKEHLLRLKAYLKRIYAVSDDRCALFDPSTKHVGLPERVQRGEASMAFQCAPPGCTPADELLERLCASTQESAEAMREEAPVGEETSIFLSILAEYNRISHAVKNDPDDLKAAPRPKMIARKAAPLARKSSRLGRGKAEDPDEEYVSDSNSRSSAVSVTSESSVSGIGVATRSSGRATKRPASYRYDDYVVGDEGEEDNGME